MPHFRALPLALLALLSLAQASPEEPTKPAPKLVIKDKQLDFGEVIHGRKTVISVPLLNAGTAPLVIKDVKPSCGCTVADFPRTIAPGKIAQLKLEFDSALRQPGYQSFRISIYTNDATQRDQGAYCTVLSLRGEVRTMFRLLPMGAFYGEFIHGLKAVTKTVRVVGIDHAKGGFSLTLATKLPDYLSVKIAPWTGPAGQRGQEIRVTLDPKVPPGQVNMPLEFRTTVKIQPALRFTVAALVNRRIMGPGLVDFGSFARAEGSKRLAMIARRDGVDGLPLVKVVSPYPWLKAVPNPRDPRSLNLELEVTAGAPPGSFAGTIHLLFDDPNQAQLDVHVTGRIRSTLQATPSILLLPKTAKQGSIVGRLHCAKPLTKVEVQPASCGLTAQVTATGAVIVLSGTVLPTQPARLILFSDVAGEERVELPILPR
ncbi:MAG: DUF1573 domain-containing protein [Planctomycetes bacterium]|nr:DUF1573 domain-containing protein [Planctomycetota bacterium]